MTTVGCSNKPSGPVFVVVGVVTGTPAIAWVWAVWPAWAAVAWAACCRFHAASCSIPWAMAWACAWAAAIASNVVWSNAPGPGTTVVGVVVWVAPAPAAPSVGVTTEVLPPCAAPAPAAAPPAAAAAPAPAPVPIAVPPAAAAPIAPTTPAAPPCAGVLLALALSNISWRFTTSSSKSACSASDTPSLLPCSAAAFAVFNPSVALVTSLGFASPAMVIPAPTVAGIGRGMTLVFEPGSKIC